MVKTIIGLVLSIILFSAFAWGQASVDESLETAFIWVDANKGSDSNPGTQQKPLKTVGAAASMAAANNRNKIGTRVTINPGTYRETVMLGQNPNDTNMPITFEAATDGTAIMSGADVWTGWSVDGLNPSIFTHSWPYHWGNCPLFIGGPTEQEIVLRREMIVVNGVVMTQVLALPQMLAGTFYVNESGGSVYLWPPSGTNMSTATVEVATRDPIFSIQGKNDMVLRGLTFQYANSCRGNAAVTVLGPSSNILIDTDNFLWNNSQGQSFARPTSYITAENSVADHNGEGGFQAWKVKNALWQDDTASYNNWRGAQGAFYQWNSGGYHFYGVHDSTATGLTATFNQTHGIHWDIDNEDITAGSIISSENVASAVMIENSEGPFTLSNSYLCNSDIWGDIYYGGLALRFARDVTLDSDVFSNNQVSQILVGGHAGGSMVTNWETGQRYTLYTENLAAMKNTVDSSSGQQVFQDGYLTTDWNKFSTTLVSDYNTWWNASDSSAFTVPVPRIYSVADLPGWQKLNGQDQHSSFKAPAGGFNSPCQVTAVGSDYWFIANVVSQTTSPGGSTSFVLTVTPIAGFKGTIQLGSDGVKEISGVTGSWSPGSITNAGSSTFTITTKSSTRAGTYPVTLIANSGNLTRTSMVFLVVQ